MERKLYRSRLNSKIAGICGGLGDYFQIDPTIIRTIAILLILLKGIAILGYLIAWMIIPRYPIGVEESKPKEYAHKWGAFIPGIILVLLGLFFLFENLFWWFNFHGYFMPIVLIALGVALVLSFNKCEQKQKNMTAAGVYPSAGADHAE